MQRASPRRDIRVKVAREQRAYPSSKVETRGLEALLSYSSLSCYYDEYIIYIYYLYTLLLLLLLLLLYYNIQGRKPVA